MSSLLQRLKERKLFQWGLAYLAGAWLVFQGIEVLAEPWNLSVAVQRTIHVLLGIGFFVTLILAWYHGEKGRQRASGVELLILAGILVIAAAALAILEREPQAEVAAGAPEVSPVAVSDQSVAVLPFVNIGGDPENEYFSDGITEEIITKLARIESLQVASRTSVSRFKHTEADISEIAMQLGVRYVLEGSVRRASEKVRITAQLIDCETGFHLWAEEFDGTLEDIFDVQEQTALQIAEALNLQLTPEERQAVRHRYTDNTEAYDAYLQGQALLIFFDDRDKLRDARAHFEQALTLEPDYAPALAGLASVEAHTYRNLDPSEDRLSRGERLARRALELDSELVRAQIALGEISAARYDYVGAEERFRDALVVDPEDPYAWDLLSWTLAYQQPPRAVEAEQAAREAIRLQPDFTAAYYHLGRALFLQNRHQEALDAFQYILDRIPDSTLGNFGQAQTYLAMGEFATAEHRIKASMRQRVSPQMVVVLSYAYAAQSKMDEALAELERALKLDYRDFEALESTPYLSELREDPRYEELITRYRTRR